MRKKISKVWGKIRKIDQNLRKKLGKWNSCPPGTVRLATALNVVQIFYCLILSHTGTCAAGTLRGEIDICDIYYMLDVCWLWHCRLSLDTALFLHRNYTFLNWSACVVVLGQKVAAFLGRFLLLCQPIATYLFMVSMLNWIIWSKYQPELKVAITGYWWLGLYVWGRPSVISLALLILSWNYTIPQVFTG